MKNNYGDTPLHLAIKLKDLNLTKLLIENHAEIVVINKRNQTPVDLASVTLILISLSEMKNIYNLHYLLLMKKICVK